jgi:hypothetical protein
MANLSLLSRAVPAESKPFLRFAAAGRKRAIGQIARADSAKILHDRDRGVMGFAALNPSYLLFRSSSPRPTLSFLSPCFGQIGPKAWAGTEESIEA